MPWDSAHDRLDSRRRMAELVDQAGYPAPLPFVDPNIPLGLSDISVDCLTPAYPHPCSRLLHGPFVMNGDLCDVMPGPEAIVMVSPKGDRILMQNEGKVTFHVPAGWRLIVGSKPLSSQIAQDTETSAQAVLCLENIPHLYQEADLFS